MSAICRSSLQAWPARNDPPGGVTSSAVRAEETFSSDSRRIDLSTQCRRHASALGAVEPERFFTQDRACSPIRHEEHRAGSADKIHDSQYRPVPCRSVPDAGIEVGDDAERALIVQPIACEPG